MEDPLYRSASTLRSFSRRALAVSTSEPKVAALTRPYSGLPSLTLSRFHVHQIVGNFLMKGGRDGDEGIGCESAVHGGVQD